MSKDPKIKLLGTRFFEDFNNLMLACLLFVAVGLLYAIQGIIQSRFDRLVMFVLMLPMVLPLVTRAYRGKQTHFLTLELSKEGIMICRTSGQQMIPWEHIKEIGVRVHKENELNWNVIYFSEEKLSLSKKVLCGLLFLDSVQEGIYYAACPSELPKELSFLSMRPGEGMKWLDIESKNVHRLPFERYQKLLNPTERMLAGVGIFIRVIMSIVFALLMLNLESSVPTVLLVVLFFLSVFALIVSDKLIKKWVDAISI